jgi:molybdate transport system regulatory protein
MVRYPGLVLRVLGKNHRALGPGKAELIAHIDKTGSISAAARAMGMSYRRAWQLVEALNASFVHPVVTTEVGGRRGGGALVTPFGRALVRRYRIMEEKASTAIAQDLQEITRSLRKKPPAGRPSR